MKMSSESQESNGQICIVFDANVLISAVLVGVQAEYALRLVIENRVRGVVSESILTEIERKLIKKFQRSPQEVKLILDYFRQIFMVVIPSKVIAPKLRDSRDLHVLGTAIAAKAHLILTTDRDLLILKRFERIGIIHPKTLRWTFPTN